jgi:site-specific DNA-adenine methylase
MKHYCHHPYQGRNKLRRRVSHRGTAFTKEEDSVLCSAFLNISKDPIIGVNQNMDAYYNKIYDYYHEHKPEGSVQS